MTAAERFRSLARGACVLLIAMGLGRFAFTALLPPMQADLGFADADAGLMASLNLAGYLLGVIWAGRTAPARRPALFRIALGLAVASLAAMAAPIGLLGWDAVRLIAGLTSGLLFVLATGFVIERGAAAGPSGAALHFAGVGTGIAVSGLVAAAVPDWRWGWLGLAGLAVALAVPALGLARTPATRTAVPVAGRLRWNVAFTLLTVAYALEGLGYIVDGTFLVAILRRLPETAPFAPWAWVIAGLAAVPSPLVWSRLAHRFGAWPVFAAACLVQAVGIVLPLFGTPAAALVSAVCFGFTFIGITGLAIGLAARLQPGAAGAATALITVGYGIGQVIGPWAAGLAATRVAGFALPLAAAATVVLVAAGLAAIGAVVDPARLTAARRPSPAAASD